jgi:nucleoside-diphosphate-sugar epimerase
MITGSTPLPLGRDTMITESPRVLLTGASGFLGLALAQRLSSDGNRVTAIVRNTSDPGRLERLYECAEVSVLDRDYSNIAAILEKSEPEVVIHVAATSLGAEDPNSIRAMVDANVLLPSLLLTEMRTRGIKRFVNTGSSWQTVGGGDYDPFNFYSATKQAFEDILTLHAKNGLAAITLRLFDTYGPFDPRNKIVNLLLRTITSDELLQMSPGAQEIDLVHIDDVVEAYKMAVVRLLSTGSCKEELSGHEIYSVSSGTPITLRAIVATIERLSGRPCNVNFGGRPYRAGEIMFPRTCFQPIPGWKPSRSLEEGLAECLDRLCSSNPERL